MNYIDAEQGLEGLGLTQAQIRMLGYMRRKAWNRGVYNVPRARAAKDLGLTVPAFIKAMTRLRRKVPHLIQGTRRLGDSIRVVLPEARMRELGTVIDVPDQCCAGDEITKGWGQDVSTSEQSQDGQIVHTGVPKLSTLVWTNCPHSNKISATLVLDTNATAPVAPADAGATDGSEAGAVAESKSETETASASRTKAKAKALRESPELKQELRDWTAQVAATLNLRDRFEDLRLRHGIDRLRTTRVMGKDRSHVIEHRDYTGSEPWHGDATVLAGLAQTANPLAFRSWLRGSVTGDSWTEAGTRLRHVACYSLRASAGKAWDQSPRLTHVPVKAIARARVQGFGDSLGVPDTVPGPEAPELVQDLMDAADPGHWFRDECWDVCWAEAARRCKAFGVSVSDYCGFADSFTATGLPVPWALDSVTQDQVLGLRFWNAVAAITCCDVGDLDQDLRVGLGLYCYRNQLQDPELQAQEALAALGWRPASEDTGDAADAVAVPLRTDSRPSRKAFVPAQCLDLLGLGFTQAQVNAAAAAAMGCEQGWAAV